MALILKDRVKETTTVTGTGTASLLGAVTGFQSFSAIGNANTTYYCIANSNEWEVGIGTYTLSGTTLARTTVLSSSNGGSLVNFSAGTKDVFVTYPSGKSVNYEQNGGVVISESGSSAALRITNTGTGNSLVVEDSANPDSSPFVIDATGNVGVGITPSAWLSSARSLDISGYASFSTWNNASGVINNAYYNSSSQWIYKNSAAASNYYQVSGQHVWSVAPSGTAGAAITFTQAMTLNTSGNLGIGNTPSGAYKLEVSGKAAATTQVSTNGITVNSQTMTTSQTIAAGTSGFTVGPFTMAPGAVLTIESGARHVII